MRTHPLLDVEHVNPDPDLVGKVPPAWALYYVALPLAREDGEVSVAMAHPENATALAKLSTLLDGPVSPVRSSAAAIRTVLQTFHPRDTQPASGILGWEGESDSQYSTANWTEFLSRTLHEPFTLCCAHTSGHNGHVSSPLQGRHRLLVHGQPAPASLPEVLGRATCPVFLLRGAAPGTVNRVLVILRGFSSDELALDWGARLVHPGGGSLTVLPVSEHRPSSLVAAFTTSGSYRQELDGYFRRPELRNVNTCLTVRQGQPVSQIGDEAAALDYDLIIVGAEGDGAFVASVLAELDRRHVHAGRPVLVLRPTI